MRKRPRKEDDIHNGFGEWGGYMDAKIAKLEEQFNEEASKNPYKQSDLFAGISIFVNGLTNPSADELKRIMMTHGGVYHTYQRSWTNFIIATNLPDVKVRQITSAKIVNPQWIVDCLKANRILNYSNYLLYTNCKESQPKINFTKKQPEAKTEIQTQTENCKKQPNDSYSESPPTQSIFGLNLNILNGAIRDDEDKNESVDNAVIEKLGKSTEPIARNEIRKGYARTAVDPNFLSEFYNNSRLHHIATLGASFKHHILRVRETHNGRFPALELLKKNIKRSHQTNLVIGKKLIMHIDMDCFFVSVGLRTRPHLKGYPIAVTHSKGQNGNNLQNIEGVDRKKEMELYMKRHEEKYHVEHGDDESRAKPARQIDNSISLSEIASCSYEARKMGIKNGMFVGQALKLCPQLKTIPYDFDAYKEVAHILYDTITQYTVDVEAVSCDEMYVNLTDVIQTLECSVDDFVSHIRNEIIEKTQCPCSAGIGENKLQARMATKQAKPNGQFHLQVENVEDYFSKIEISDLPGVGYSTTQKCMNLDLKTCADLQRMPLVKLQQEFGKKLGETLHQNCRGIDNKPLTYDQVRKSVSAEVNYGIRFKEDHELCTFLNQLCAEVHSRLTEVAAKGKTITLKYMVRAQDAPIETAKFMGHGFCDNVTKSVTLAAHTSDLTIISQTVFSIKNILNVPAHELRGIGIQISKLNTQIDIHKKNPVKALFEKVQAKKILPTDNSTTRNRNDGERPKSLRKVKSFNGTPTNKLLDKQNQSNKKWHKIYEDLDLSVLAELPDDIQNEILREKDRILSDNNVNAIEQKSLGPKKTLARKLENDFGNVDLKPAPRIVECAYISDNNILKSNEWRQILSYWLQNSGDPIDTDVQIILNYFKEFACAQKFSELMLIIKYLHRRMELMECQWHRIYANILDICQCEVKNAYGPNINLYVNETFDCKKCIK